MKLSELGLDKRERGALIKQIQGQLSEAELTEVASVVQWRTEHELDLYVATDAGIYVGDYGPKDERDGDVALNGGLTPWSDVAGARMFWAGFPDGTDGHSLTVKVGTPAIDFTVQPTTPSSQKAASDFGIACMKYQRGAAAASK